MTLDGAFESTGAAGKAQALTDRNDPSTTPEKASPEVLVMIFLHNRLFPPVVSADAEARRGAAAT
jgi:hypothetical protein